MKAINKYFPFFVISLFLMFGSCEGPINQLDDSFGNAELKKSTPQNSVELTQDEIDGILFMREEEKLAHDVYVKFYEKYAHNIFLNISESEQTHTDAILKLINYYGLEDPAKDGIGEFENKELQDLYNELIDMGNNGLVSALEVGIIIEEKDIVDIVALMEKTDVKNILLVYGNLLSGSENHLKSFEMVLDQLEKELNK